MTFTLHLALAFLCGCHLGLCFWPKPARPIHVPVLRLAL